MLFRSDPVFYRTRYLNILLRSAKFPIAGIWDTDVIIPPVQLRESVGRICSGCVMCFPYDGRFIFLNEAMSDRIRKEDVYKRQKRDFVLDNDLGGGDFTVDSRSSGKYWIDVLDLSLIHIY